MSSPRACGLQSPELRFREGFLSRKGFSTVKAFSCPRPVEHKRLRYLVLAKCEETRGLGVPKAGRSATGTCWRVRSSTVPPKSARQSSQLKTQGQGTSMSCGRRLGPRRLPVGRSDGPGNTQKGFFKNLRKKAKKIFGS
jgi:hypothetical protein